nr:hypothetical protein [Tanacetum cinerariifolium]
MGANRGVEGVNENVEGANRGAPNFSTIIAQQLQNLLPATLAQVGNQGNVGIQDGNVVNENVQENIRNMLVNGNQVGCSYKKLLACNPKEYDGIMEIEPGIENITLNEYLEYEAKKERRLWDNVRSKSSPTRVLQLYYPFLLSERLKADNTAKVNRLCLCYGSGIGHGKNSSLQILKIVVEEVVNRYYLTIPIHDKSLEKLVRVPLRSLNAGPNRVSCVRLLIFRTFMMYAKKSIGVLLNSSKVFKGLSEVANLRKLNLDLLCDPSSDGCQKTDAKFGSRNKGFVASVVGGGCGVDCEGGRVKDGNDCKMIVLYTGEDSVITKIVVGGGCGVDCEGGRVKDGNDCKMIVLYTGEDSVITKIGSDFEHEIDENETGSKSNQEENEEEIEDDEEEKEDEFVKTSSNYTPINDEDETNVESKLKIMLKVMRIKE